MVGIMAVSIGIAFFYIAQQLLTTFFDVFYIAASNLELFEGLGDYFTDEVLIPLTFGIPVFLLGALAIDIVFAVLSMDYDSLMNKPTLTYYEFNCLMFYGTLLGTASINGILRIFSLVPSLAFVVSKSSDFILKNVFV